MRALAPIGIGLLGWSDIARRRFLPALQRSARARLAGIGTRSPTRATREAGWPPDATVLSYEDLLAQPGVDAVYVSLPNHLHEEWSCRALSAGKHVLCEKPLAPTLAAVERMAGAAGAAGCYLEEAVMFRHHPQHGLVRALLAEGRIGTLRLLRAGFGFHHTRPGDFRLDPACGGGAVQDLLTYVVGAAGLFLPTPLREASGFARRRAGLDLSAGGSAAAETGELFAFTVGFEQAYECYYELIGSHGRMRLDRAFSTPPDLANTLRLDTADQTHALPLPAADHFAVMLDDFCDRLSRVDEHAATRSRLLRAHRQLELVRSRLRPVEITA